MDNGRTPRQIRKKDGAANRTFRLSQMQETIPRSLKQKEDLKLKATETIHAKKPTKRTPLPRMRSRGKGAIQDMGAHSSLSRQKNEDNFDGIWHV